jgi:hypothetical protein
MVLKKTVFQALSFLIGGKERLDKKTRVKRNAGSWRFQVFNRDSKSAEWDACQPGVASSCP